MNMGARVLRIYEAIRTEGGDPLLVGGCVRDYLLGIEPKDIDTEVYGMEGDKLIAILRRYTKDENGNRIGRVDTVGESFVVIKLIIFPTETEEGEEYDFSLPRKDSKTGEGHKGFTIKSNPFLTIPEASARRDYTMNSVCARVLVEVDGEFSGIDVIDSFGGIDDLKARILRHTSDAFAEDALRVLRGMQFAGRMEMTVATETAKMAFSVRDEYVKLTKERVWGEWYKWATKSVAPSYGLAFLFATKWVYLYPELSAMIGLEQEPEWHPEGSVWEHTKHVCDAAMVIARDEGLTMNQRAALVFAALCHDMGKASTTVRNDQGRIVSPGHAEAGIPLAESFMRSIGAPEAMVQEVAALTGYHMRHLSGISAKAARRLAKEMRDTGATTPPMLACIMEADYSGRPWTGDRMLPGDALEFVSQMEVAAEAVKPLLMGRHMIAMGVRPGKEMGVILKAVEAAQVEGVVTNFEQAQAMAMMMIVADSLPVVTA